MGSMTRQIRRIITRNEARGILNQYGFACPKCRSAVSRRSLLGKRLYAVTAGGEDG